MIDGTCKGCGETCSSNELEAFGGYCLECFDCDVPKRDARIAELEAEVVRLKALAPLCGDHTTGTGTRSGCVICGLMKLTGAMSKISYALGEPNEMEMSKFDLDYDEDGVVAEAKRLRESNVRMLAIIEWAKK